MLAKLRFYFVHSFNDLLVNKQRTLFALFCILGGVAAIVSLQTLAVMIEDTLTGNLQQNNRGDIQVSIRTSQIAGDEEQLAQGVEDGILISEDKSFFGQQFTEFRFTEDGLDALQSWIDENYPGQIEYNYRQPITDVIGIVVGGGIGTTLTNADNGFEARQVTPTIIDPAVYPFYSEVVTRDGIPLSEALISPSDIVISALVADTLEVAVGDQVTINGSETVYTVQGLVETEAEVKNPANDAFAALFGFYYISQDGLDAFEDIAPQADVIYLQLSDPSLVDEVNEAFITEFPYLNTITTTDLERDYQDLAENIDQLVTIMGLVSLLIGAIGIINTMQVIVRRRTLEIAVLKTIGMQGNQITILFLVEAFIMGIIGSILGILVGWLGTFAIKAVAETFLGQDLPFRIAMAPAVNGFIIGVIVTTVFGFYSTLRAGVVRPGLILRPNESAFPIGRAWKLFFWWFFIFRKSGRRDLWAALVDSRFLLFTLIVMVIALTAIVTPIIGSASLAFQIVLGTFVAAGVLYVVLWILILLIGKFFPSFGIVDLTISLREMVVGRSRGAITLLALVVGVFSLSLITLFTESINGLLEGQILGGGNIIIQAGNQGDAVQRIEEALAEHSATDYQISSNYSMELIQIDDPDGTVLVYEDFVTRMNAAEMGLSGPPVNEEDPEERTEILVSSFSTIDALTVDELSAERVFVDGRELTADDEGQPVMVVSDNPFFEAANIGVGSKLTFNFTGGGLLASLGQNKESITFEVVGVYSQASNPSASIINSPTYALLSSFGDREPDSTNFVVDIPEENVSALRRSVTEIPGTLLLETAVINDLINSILSQFTAFPTLVAGLGLIVGGIVIANSVALSTMERRKQIAVMKSIGLQRERVLGMLLIENGFMGLIGGLLGVGIGLVGLIALFQISEAPMESISYTTAGLLMLLCIAVALIAAMTTAWGASGEKPLNVLRHE